MVKMVSMKRHMNCPALTSHYGVTDLFASNPARKTENATSDTTFIRGRWRNDKQGLHNGGWFYLSKARRKQYLKACTLQGTGAFTVL